VTDLAIGNVVGSNICNVLFILGASALAAPLVVSSRLIRLDVPLMIAVSVIAYLLALDGVLSPGDGALLFAALIAYVVWTVWASRRESRDVKEEFEEVFEAPEERAAPRVLLNVLLAAAGLVMLAVGSEALVRGAVNIATMLGVSQLVIGLTIVALGTSLPEAAASIVATIRGERDIAVGNVVGSNLFNILCVLGLASFVAPRGIDVSPVALRVDMPIMIAVAAACLPIFFTGRRITRWNGAMLFGYYLAYLTDLVLRALEAPVARNFQVVMLFFVIPLTMISLAVGMVRSIRTRQSDKKSCSGAS
jgi:cation:H+ antiporter